MGSDCMHALYSRPEGTVLQMLPHSLMDIAITVYKVWYRTTSSHESHLECLYQLWRKRVIVVAEPQLTILVTACTMRQHKKGME